MCRADEELRRRSIIAMLTHNFMDADLRVPAIVCVKRADHCFFFFSLVPHCLVIFMSDGEKPPAISARPHFALTHQFFCLFVVFYVSV